MQDNHYKKATTLVGFRWGPLFNVTFPVWISNTIYFCLKSVDTMYVTQYGVKRIFLRWTTILMKSQVLPRHETNFVKNRFPAGDGISRSKITWQFIDHQHHKAAVSVNQHNHQVEILCACDNMYLSPWKKAAWKAIVTSQQEQEKCLDEYKTISCECDFRVIKCKCWCVSIFLFNNPLNLNSAMLRHLSMLPNKPFKILNIICYRRSE